MTEKRLWMLLFLIGCTVSAQIKGVVKDSISGKPIPFVSIWSENQNIGTTSEEDGSFVINTNENSKKLLFSALGFEKKAVTVSNATVVKLNPTDIQLDEVVISKSLGTRQIEIGKTNNTICQAFDNGPRIDVKYFPYLPSYKKTRYIKNVTIYTDSRIENATIRVHFYSVDTNGYPGEELLSKDMLVPVRKGTITNLYDVSDFNLLMPKNGIFVGFEKLIIEKNKLEKVKTDPVTKKASTQITYYPFVLYNRVEREFLYTYSGGKWNRQSNTNAITTDKITIYEPSINLILTN